MPKENSRKSSKSAVQKRKTTKRLDNQRRTLIIGSSLLLIGLSLFGLQLFNLWRSQQTTAAPQSIGDILDGSSVNGDARISGIPVRITVPSVDIDLEVIRGYHYQSSNTWTLTLNKAQWGVMTSPANDKSGATFIYGHYRKGVFLKLPKIQPGAIAGVKTDKGNVFTYRFRASSIVPPSDDSIFKYSGKPVLILQTCTGIRFENRQLFVFDLIDVE